ncbi:MAG: hypothetical protein EBR82_70820 [Caulobacteraceae bacterium]|nr:hypothetical protein [Caulobacteraceae bacterium]
MRFRTLNRNIRVWMDRDRSGPSEEADYANINNWVHAHRVRIDEQSLIDTADELAREFPRASAIEIHTGSMTGGVLVYPRWP